MDKLHDSLARTEVARDKIPTAKEARPDKTVIARTTLESTVIARLIEEVRIGVEPRLDAYNRTYHRHNR